MSGLQSFLRLKDSPLCGRTTVCLPAHPLGAIWGRLHPGATVKMADLDTHVPVVQTAVFAGLLSPFVSQPGVEPLGPVVTASLSQVLVATPAFPPAGAQGPAFPTSSPTCTVPWVLL